MNSLKKSILASIMIMAMCLIMAGCGAQKSEELETYKTNMSNFYDKLAYYDSAINSIDTSSEGAKAELLGYLDEMNEEYKKMAEYEIPDQFSGISDIAKEAADYMQMANEFYHQAYDGDFDEDSEALASQYYQRANSRAHVILQVLHGEVPSGEGVTVTTEESYQFSTVATSSEE